MGLHCLFSSIVLELFQVVQNVKQSIREVQGLLWNQILKGKKWCVSLPVME